MNDSWVSILNRYNCTLSRTEGYLGTKNYSTSSNTYSRLRRSLMIVVAGLDLCHFRLHSFQTGWCVDRIDEGALKVLDGIPSAKHYNFYDPKGQIILMYYFTFKH